ncbi:hypothetical protein O0882_10370 [Janthinobacterium sp. SUN073]|uniref:hypothetical protein n=1 Tax=Janthinobacterium sp. SUN073 TaxID=3004102 RepID=UPI0025B19EE6|nr:hypothetical protein [Janthinobacterium sp. SUN073]MDN2696725.1 hypothetical protein [Janthinobacterium sp. SUN073]
MKRLNPVFLAALLALFSTTGAVHASDAAVPVPLAAPGASDAAHVAAVREMIEAMQMQRIMRRLFQVMGEMEDQQGEVMRHMALHVSDEEILARLAPVYVPYISAEDARQVARNFRSSLAQRDVAATLARARITQGDTDPHFTASERVEAQRLTAMPAAFGKDGRRAQIHGANRAMYMQWSREYHDRLLAQAMQAVRAYITAALDLQPGQAAPKLVLQPTGLPSLDKVLLIVADVTLATTTANLTYAADIDSYHLDLVLAPERLVSAPGIATSKATVIKAGDRIEAYLAQIDRLQQSAWGRLQASKSGSDARQIIEAGMAARYDFMLRFGENQRSLMDLFTRVLQFAESRLGAIELRGESLAFRDEADQVMYRSLIAQLKKASEEESALVDEAQQTAQRSLKKLGG